MAERVPSSPGPLLPARDVRKRLVLAFLLAGLLPLLLLVYLGLPVLLPSTVAAPLYPKGAFVFFALLAFLAVIEMGAFYMIYSEVFGQMQRGL